MDALQKELLRLEPKLMRANRNSNIHNLPIADFITCAFLWWFDSG